MALRLALLALPILAVEEYVALTPVGAGVGGSTLVKWARLSYDRILLNLLLSLSRQARRSLQWGATISSSLLERELRSRASSS